VSSLAKVFFVLDSRVVEVSRLEVGVAWEVVGVSQMAEEQILEEHELDQWL
jgi:hypothetical protein